MSPPSSPSKREKEKKKREGIALPRSVTVRMVIRPLFFSHFDMQGTYIVNSLESFRVRRPSGARPTVSEQMVVSGSKEAQLLHDISRR